MLKDSCKLCSHYKDDQHTLKNNQGKPLCYNSNWTPGGYYDESSPENPTKKFGGGLCSSHTDPKSIQPDDTKYHIIVEKQLYDIRDHYGKDNVTRKDAILILQYLIKTQPELDKTLKVSVNKLNILSENSWKLNHKEVT